MTIFLASLGFGLVTSSVLAIAAVGFTLQFGVTDVLNLAYGAVMIAGAYLAYVLNSHGVNIWIAAGGRGRGSARPGRCCSTRACTRPSSGAAPRRSRW